jgi:stage V sporulation protein R
MYDDGFLTDGVMIEWLKSHTNVIYQPPVGHKAYSGINPYALGFAMYTDIKRICEAPTDEDRAWFPDIAGAPWLPTLDHAMRNFKDESFIGQYLSPKLMRELRLFAIRDDEKAARARGRRHPRRRRLPARARGAVAPVRPGLARAQHPGLERQPARRPLLTLRHFQHNDRPLHDSAAGGAQARGPAVGLRRAPGERQRQGRRHQALDGAGAA